VGHGAVHPDLLVAAYERMQAPFADGLLLDGRVGACGDDINLVLTHECGVDDEEIHRFAWDTFVNATEVAKALHVYGAGQDLLADAFSGNICGAEPHGAELELDERPSEPFVVFAADKKEPGAWNLPLYNIICDPFNTAGLVIDSKMHEGFAVEVFDLLEHSHAVFACPEELYDLLVYIGTTAAT
jgi:fructose 1,6-bisphosphate aldolase/phosphatase